MYTAGQCRYWVRLGAGVRRCLRLSSGRKGTIFELKDKLKRVHLVYHIRSSVWLRNNELSWVKTLPNLGKVRN